MAQPALAARHRPPACCRSCSSQTGTLGAGAEAGLQVELDNVIAIGRKDYILRSVHPQASCRSLRAGCPCLVCISHDLLHAPLQFGLQWNVTWGRLSRLTELEVQQLGDAGAVLRFLFGRWSICAGHLVSGLLLTAWFQTRLPCCDEQALGEAQGPFSQTLICCYRGRPARLRRPPISASLLALTSRSDACTQARAARAAAMQVGCL